MNANIEDDPRLSAWLLDEMSTSERKEFEKILNADPSAKATANELRGLAEEMESAFASEPEYRMTDIQREHVTHPVVPKPIEFSPEDEQILPWKKLRFTGDVTEKMRIAERMDERRKDANFPTYWVSVAAAVVLGMIVIGSILFVRQTEQPIVKSEPKEEVIISILTEGTPETSTPVIVSSSTKGYTFRNPGDENYRTSTFELHPGAASYHALSNLVYDNAIPSPDSVRVDELVNYFAYEYPEPKEAQSMSVSVESAPCPWEPEHQLVQIGLRGRDASEEETSKTEIATDVDVQVEFDPAKVKEYRLIGYDQNPTEIASTDCNFSTGDSTTALYEVVPTEKVKTDDSLLTVHLNYNEPGESQARRLAARLAFSEQKRWSDATEDFRFASSVAGFGMLLREDEKDDAKLSRIKAMARNSLNGSDKERRKGFVDLIEKVQKLSRAGR